MRQGSGAVLHPHPPAALLPRRVRVQGRRLPRHRVRRVCRVRRAHEHRRPLPQPPQSPRPPRRSTTSPTSSSLPCRRCSTRMRSRSLRGRDGGGSRGVNTALPWHLPGCPPGGFLRLAGSTYYLRCLSANTRCIPKAKSPNGFWPRYHGNFRLEKWSLTFGVPAMQHSRKKSRGQQDSREGQRIES